jgi:mannose/fructose/N-acetylgalactosamine-specific phosphotransferase system component IIB
VLFTWLKQAGYTKEQILTWIEIEQDDLSAVEQLQDRGIRVILNQVFPE